MSPGECNTTFRIINPCTLASASELKGNPPPPNYRPWLLLAQSLVQRFEEPGRKTVACYELFMLLKKQNLYWSTASSEA
jgi:hypothetical protein